VSNNKEPQSNLQGFGVPPILNPLPPSREGEEPANKFPEALREEIALAVLTDKRKIVDVAKSYGVGRNIVGQIVREHFSQTADLQNIELAHGLGEVTTLMLQRIRNSINEIPLSQVVVAFGILTDKRRDLAGKTIQAPRNINLKIAWKDGSGAAELNVGGGGEQD